MRVLLNPAPVNSAIFLKQLQIMSFGLFALIIITARWPHDLNLFISLRSALGTRPYGISQKPHYYKAKYLYIISATRRFSSLSGLQVTVPRTPRTVYLSQFCASGIFIAVDTWLDYLWRVINALSSYTNHENSAHGLRDNCVLICRHRTQNPSINSKIGVSQGSITKLSH